MLHIFNIKWHRNRSRLHFVTLSGNSRPSGEAQSGPETSREAQVRFDMFWNLGEHMRGSETTIGPSKRGMEWPCFSFHVLITSETKLKCDTHNDKSISAQLKCQQWQPLLYLRLLTPYSLHCHQPTKSEDDWRPITLWEGISCSSLVMRSVRYTPYYMSLYLFVASTRWQN